MTALSPKLAKNLRQILLRCGPFEDERVLRTLFVDGRIAPWRENVPDADSAAARAALLVDFLYDKYHATEGKNALFLFLKVLQEKISPEDECHKLIGDLAQALAMKQDLVQLVEAASQNVVLYTRGPILSRPAKLFGRKALLERLDGPLAQANCVLLFGLAGSGKTAVAAAAAERYLQRWHRPVIWLECGPIEAGTAFDELAQRLGTEAEKQSIYLASGAGDLKAVHDMLSHYPGYLLVLDNVWNGPALYEVLRAIPESMPVIVTSRTEFSFGFDVVLRVDELDVEAGLALLEAHAGSGMRNRKEALQLCEMLGYHAYALEIAGTLLKGGRRSPRQIARRIGRTPHALSLPGKKSVQALLEESLKTLDEGARKAFMAIGGLHAPGVTPQLLAAYLGIGAESAWAALDALDQHSLARYQSLGAADGDQAPTTEFYRVHDITFSYARVLHEENGRDPRKLLAAVRAYLAQHDGDFETLQRDLPNILAAARTAQEIDEEALVEIVSKLTLEGYADRRGYSLELIKWLEAAIAVVRRRSEDGGALHFLLGKLGNAYFGRGEAEKALALYGEALALAPDTLRAVLLEAIVGKVLARLGRVEKATVRFARAYERAQTSGDDRALLFVLEQESLAASYVEDYEKIRALAEKGIEISTRLGDRVREAFARINLGSVELLHDADAHAALAHHRQVYAIGKAQDDHILQAYAQFGMAKDYDMLGDRQQAETCLSRAEALFHSLGNVQDGVDVRRFRKERGYDKK